MKKNVLVIMVLVVVMTLFTACGEKGEKKEQENSKDDVVISDNSDVDVKDENNEDESDVVDADGIITMEALMACPNTSEELFSIADNGEGGAIIIDYRGIEEVLVIPEAIKGLRPTELPKYIFANDCGIKAIRFPDSLEEVSDMSCGLNNSLQVVVLGKNTKVVGESAFMSCDNLHDVQLNEGLETIKMDAFWGCSSLKSITIPASVTEIGDGAFAGIGDDFIIYGKSGSCAEEYAIENNKQFIAID